MQTLANIFWLGTKELCSFFRDWVLLGPVIYSFTLAVIAQAILGARSGLDAFPRHGADRRGFSRGGLMEAHKRFGAIGMNPACCRGGKSGFQGVRKMPLYSFHCAECDKHSELLMRFSDKAVCPACGGEKMEPLVSRVAPELKSDAIKKSWRARAAREGDLSNFSKAETKL